MRIGIIGAGNGGLSVALYLIREYYDSDIEIEIYYDPSVPIEKVGQGSLVNFVSLCTEVLDINWYDNDIDATFKTGILYEGWGKKKSKFFHSFPMDFMSAHYSPNKLRECMIRKNVCKFIETSVEDYNEIDCDYIFDCRGKPKDYSYYKILKNPINSVILGREEFVDVEQNWTRCIATPDGWMFSIPNKEFTSYGYLYNDNCTKDVDAKKYVEEELCIKTTDTLHFKNYIAKKPIWNDRVILNGNKLLFIEPLEASSVESYIRWTSLVTDWIFEGRSKTSILDALYQDVEDVQNFILWHYANGSKWDTTFWNYAVDLSTNHHYDETFFEFIISAKTNNKLNLIDEDKPPYGHWYATSFKNWIDGVHP